MSSWDLDRLCGASLAPKKATYKAVPSTPYQIAVSETNPELFEFEAVSVGDDEGQAFIIPLDESSEEVAGIVIKALEFYKEYGNVGLSLTEVDEDDIEDLFTSIFKSFENLEDKDVTFAQIMLMAKQLDMLKSLGRVSKTLLKLRGVDA